MFQRVFLAIVLLLTYSPVIFASTISSLSGVEVQALESGDGTKQSIFTEKNSYEYANISSTLYGYGNLSTGHVGTRTDGAGQAVATMFDTLTFDTGDSESALISFTTSYEGYLSSSSKFSNPYSQFGVRIYDITGISEWLETSSFFNLFDRVTPLASLESLYSDGFYVRFADIGEYDGSDYLFYDQLSGSFTAVSGHTYGIRITSNSYATGDASADFSGTGIFEFTNLDGASYTSGSGAFLNQSNGNSSMVPEPNTMILLSFGLLGIAGFSRRKN